MPELGTSGSAGGPGRDNCPGLPTYRALSGRLITASRDDLDDLIARAKQIREDNLYALSFQR
jgi:hypothetical protein